MSIGGFVLLMALTTSDAVAILLNSPASVSVTRYAEAKALVEREAAEGKPLQQFVIGVLCPSNSNSRAYLDQSRGRILALAEKKNNPLAWYLVSLESNDLRFLRRAANGGNVQALNALGTIAVQESLSRPLGTNALEKILHTGYEYFRRAAAARDPNGFINLGTCYLRGFGCEINLELAFECFKTAAEMGHPEGMDYVSASYEHGYGVKRDEYASLFWRMKAQSLRGDKAATQWLKDRK